tara:strand:+ start:2541 stop:6878 length:4338 start_codon:yes stop_codon:yes gene_type:complete
MAGKGQYKSDSGGVGSSNQYLPQFHSPTQDEYLSGLLERLSVVEQNPRTGRINSGVMAPDGSKVQTTAETKAEQEEIRSNVDNVYDKTFKDSTQNKFRKSNARYTAASAGVDNSVTQTENTEGLRKTDAATIAQDQSWARAVLANSRFNRADAYTDPNLEYGEEERLLEAFSTEMGIDPKEIQYSPSLRAAFGRYLGKATGTLDADMNYAYDMQGNELRDENGKTFKADTPYVEPRIIDEYSNQDNTLASREIVSQFRGSKERYVEDVMARGFNGKPVTREQAEGMYEAEGNINFDESIIDKQNVIRNREGVDDLTEVSSKMGARQYKAFQGFMDGMRKYSSSPMMASRFTEKFLGDRFKEFSPESAQELIYTFMATHSALEEKRPDAARMWAEMWMVAVLDHTQRNVYRYEEKKGQSENSAMADEETQDAIDRYDETLMTGAADEVAIGSTIFRNMGFEKATKDQKAMMGALAMSLTFETFKNSAPNVTNAAPMYQQKLIIEKSLTKGEGKNKRTVIAHTFTPAGLAVAESMQDLFNAIMPKSTRDVRYGNKKTDQAAINKLINMPVGMKQDGTYTYQGYDVPFGDTTEAAQQKEQAENVPVGIHEATQEFLQNLFEDFKESGYSLDNPDSEFMDNSLDILNHPKFYNTKGTGGKTAWKGSFGERPGFVLVTNRKGEMIHKDSPSLEVEGAEEITTLDQSQAATKDDSSDRVKDSQFVQTLAWAARNVGKTFFYDYVYGKNWRLSVDQTIGNYQHNKLARALIQSGRAAAYDLRNLDHVIRLKAGVMRRYGFDNMNPHTAALKFDEKIDGFMAMDQQAILKDASENEGWASVASILEARKIQEAFNAPGKPIYLSSFFTEIDGKTNGLGHSAMQAGDSKTAAGAFIFDEHDYALWQAYYDKIEEFQSAGRLDELRAFSKDVTGDESTFDKYLDAYNKVNSNMKGNFKNFKSKNIVSYPSMLQDKADAALKQIMLRAQEAGGPDKFQRALEIFEEGALGRAFTKKPVMIFGYGAGTARHIDQVRIFINELLKRDSSGILDKFTEEGIDVDVEFIDPLGVMMSEAINENFPAIKEFANMISLAAKEADAQGFDLFPTTIAGHQVPIGSEVYWLGQEKGDNRAFSYHHPESVDKWGKPLLNKEGKTIMVKDVAHTMKVVWDFSAKRRFAQKRTVVDENMDQMTVESMIEVLKAATQATVMMNHANDNINMQRGRYNKHKEKVALAKIAWEKKQSKLPVADRKPFVDNHTTVGDTTLHIFDGDLVLSMEAEEYADELNAVFKNMNSDKDYSHMQAIYEALTFDLDQNGNKIKEPHYDKFTQTEQYNNMTAQEKKKSVYRRRLTSEGVGIAKKDEVSTWDNRFDTQRLGNRVVTRKSMAFDWEIDDQKDGKKVIQRSKSLNRRRKENHKKKNDFTDNVTNVKQFFYSTKSVKDIINELKGSLDYMKKKV